MIRVLQDWEEVGRAIGYLKDKTYGYHSDHIKNWDLAQIDGLLSKCSKNAKILDMGCSGNVVLNYCFKAGFNSIIGIDLNTYLDRIKQILLCLQNGFRVPYQLKKMDMTRTSFADKSFDLIISLSVIEHGVPIDKFLKESSRLLKKKGRLFVSTDYWDKKLSTDMKVYGLNWKPFSKRDIEKVIINAKKYDLVLKNKKIPPVKDKVCSWHGYRYTFISLIFDKI